MSVLARAAPFAAARSLAFDRLDLLVALLAGLGALLVRLALLLPLDFDGLYGQDSFAYFLHARSLWQEGSFLYHWPWEAAPRPLFWPMAYPLAAAAAMALLGPVPRAPQAVSLLAGAATVALTCWLLHLLLASTPLERRQRRLAALVAAALVALSPLHLQNSVVAMSDALALALATLGACALLRWREGEHAAWGWALLGSTALAAAAVTRYAYLPLLALAALALLPSWRHRPWPVAGAALAGALVLLPQALYNLRYPAVFFGQQFLTGWSPANALRREFFVPGVCQEPYAWPVGLSYPAQALGGWTLLSPLALPLLAAGAWTLARAPWRGQWLLPALWAGLAWALLAGLPYQNFRYALVFLPPLAALAGLGAATLLHLGQRWGEGHAARLRPRWLTSHRLAVLGLVGLALLLAEMGVVGQRQLAGLAVRKAQDLAVVAWLDQHAPPDATVLAFDLIMTLHVYGGQRLQQIADLGPADLSQVVAAGPTYLVVNRPALERACAGLPPAEHSRWLLATFPPRQVVTLGPYTVARLGGAP